MSRNWASILGTGRFLPPDVVTNADLEKRVDTTDEWIRTRTGIKERRIAGPDLQTSDMALEAARRALKNAGLEPKDLDAIIVASLSGDYIWPATACVLQEKLGAGHCMAFDVSAACSGMVYSLGVAEGLIAAGTAKRILVVGAEKLSQIVDWSDRSTCVLFGDGAAAMVVGPSNGKAVFRSFSLGANGSMVQSLYQPAGGTLCPTTVDTVSQKLHFLKMEGKDVFKFAVRAMGNASDAALAAAGWQSSDVKLFIPHQANIRIIEAAAKHMGLSEDRVFVNVDRYGNTSAASVGIALDEAIEMGRLSPGDKLVLVAFGAGLTWAATAIEW